MAASTTIRALFAILLVTGGMALGEDSGGGFARLAPRPAESAYDWVAWAPSLAKAAGGSAKDGRPVLLVVRPSQPDLGPCCAAAELHRLPELADTRLIALINSRFIPALVVAADLESSPGSAERELFLRWKASRPPPVKPLDGLQLWLVEGGEKVVATHALSEGSAPAAANFLEGVAGNPILGREPLFAPRIRPTPPASASPAALPVAIALRRVDAEGKLLPGILKWTSLEKGFGAELWPAKGRRPRRAGAEWRVEGKGLSPVLLRLYPEWDGPESTNWIGSSSLTVTLLESGGGIHTLGLAGELTLRHAFHGVEDQPPATMRWGGRAKVLGDGELRGLEIWSVEARSMGGAFRAAAMANPGLISAEP